MFRRLLALCAIVLVVLGGLAIAARADLLQCAPPNTYFYFDIVPGLGNIRGFVCDGPDEDTGSHWHAEFGGGGLTVGIGANIAIPGLQGANGSTSQAGVSVTLASGSYVCRDERYECEPPNIYQTWNKQNNHKAKGIPIRVRPLAQFSGAPWPPVDDINVKRSWPPEAPPQPFPDYPGGPGPLAPPAPVQPPEGP